ncbi:hypothetical protein QMK17_06355 [Rhodococcus sp. G-MC3]|uniref:hypothetical protein n=1 Tax=Rhodococcus sp. G-MC3 TaxID=3046209 RepID=UPI0024BAFD67|nr:hypothetical protein [Rhodococcus sp. G-MC3]MDJ0392951.1 hypothetical protein [Rhodococcus sp. G-MC3]
MPLMEWGDGLQVAVIVALAAVGTCLLVVGAFGSGALCFGVAALWFWRLYRTGE